MTNNEPDEIVTIVYCRACEQLAIPTDLEKDGSKFRCHRCGVDISARDFHDYADLRVVEYD